MSEQQQAAFDKLSRLKVGALFMEMGTGKTKVALDLIYSKRNKVDYVLWICPFSLKSEIEAERQKWHKDLQLDNIHPELAKIFKYQWTRLENIDDEDCYKYMVKRILLCDWEGNITSKKWTFGEGVNYTPEQLQERRYMRKHDEVLKKWFDAL